MRYLLLFPILMLCLPVEAQNVNVHGLRSVIACDDSLCIEKAAGSMGMKLTIGFSGIGYLNENDTTAWITLGFQGLIGLKFNDLSLLQNLLERLINEGWTRDLNDQGEMTTYVDPKSSRWLYVEGRTLDISKIPLPGR